jgi:hypothetical protein
MSKFVENLPIIGVCTAFVLVFGYPFILLGLYILACIIDGIFGTNIIEVINNGKG